jgi:MSHA pilin protein MshC
MRGFTTIELIVVMVVMAVLAALAIPRLTDRSALQERGARDQLRGMLHHARKLAMTQQRDVCVLATPTRASAVYFAGGACSPALPVADPGGNAAFQIDMPAGVALAGAAQVRFNARGQLVPATNLTLNVGATALTISRETGLAL